jgi:hypothetical protein
MKFKRFEAIWKIFTVSPASLKNDSNVFLEPYLSKKKRRKAAECVEEILSTQKFFEKLESLATHIRKICQRLYIPRTHHRQICESPPSSSEDLKFKNDADLPESMPPKSVRLKRDY